MLFINSNPVTLSYFANLLTLLLNEVEIYRFWGEAFNKFINLFYVEVLEFRIFITPMATLRYFHDLISDNYSRILKGTWISFFFFHSSPSCYFFACKFFRLCIVICQSLLSRLHILACKINLTFCQFCHYLCIQWHSASVHSAQNSL